MTGRRAGSIVAAAALAAGLAGCAQMSGMGARAQISSTPHCTDFLFPVYFANTSADLTRQAQRVVSNAGAHIKGCTVAKVEVTGLADYRGPPQPNMELSRQRAEHVEAALIRAGLPAPTFKLRAVGDQDAVAEDVARPLRRRTDVIVTFAR